MKWLHYRNKFFPVLVGSAAGHGTYQVGTFRDNGTVSVLCSERYHSSPSKYKDTQLVDIALGGENWPVALKKSLNRSELCNVVAWNIWLKECAEREDEVGEAIRDLKKNKVKLNMSGYHEIKNNSYKAEVSLGTIRGLHKAWKEYVETWNGS